MTFSLTIHTRFITVSPLAFLRYFIEETIIKRETTSSSDIVVCYRLFSETEPIILLSTN